MRARAADHHHHQEVDQVLEREGRVQAQHVDRQRAAQTRQPGSERKRDAEQEADVDTHAGCRLLVVDRGAQLRAEPRPGEEQTQPGGDRDHQRDEKQPVGAEIDPEHA